KTYDVTGEMWFEFTAVRNLQGVDDVFLVPLIGHTEGHCGVAIRQGKGWLLHAGDAYFFRKEIVSRRRHCPPGFRFYQTMMEVNRAARLRNQGRLRGLIQRHG